MLETFASLDLCERIKASDRYEEMTRKLSSFTWKNRNSSSRKMINGSKSDFVKRTTYSKPTTLDFRLYPKENLIDSNSSLVMENNSNQKKRWSSRRTMSASAIFYLILYIFLTTSDLCSAARQDVPTNCTFPQRWEGSWFLSGYQQSIHIRGSQFSYRGKCAASDGNKYLLVDERGCHRCLVIYEKHKNVLQYKESECDGDSMYMDQSNPAALPMRSLSKSDHRGAHPNTNNNNGHSRLSSSDQYIMRSNDDMSSCSYCRGRETLQTLCDQIPGDALLYSLFRENAEPVKCPLKGPYSFTYNRGHGECKSPVSNIDSCTEESRLLLSFQACPDVQGTESTDEELTCLATWKDGNSRYLVGLVSHHHAISNEDRYRCFVYERILPMMGGQGGGSPRDGEYKLAQSGDATCNGLDSAEVGSRIMTLRKPTPAERCDFPTWFKGQKHWHALMGNSIYNYHMSDGSLNIIKANGVMQTRALCEQINKQTSTEMMAVVQHTTGCNTGFMCMVFYRRDTHVIEIQSGKPANRLEDACAPDYFDFNKTPFITLLANNPDPQICPLEGLYYLHGAIGPPYVTSRHKRNHNGKHNHHHRHGISSLSSAAAAAASSLSSSSRLRRDAPFSSSQKLPLNPTDGNGNVVIETSSLRQLNLNPNIKISEQDEAELNAVITGNGDIRRNRRDASGCVVNTKARRHLWVGCSAPNIIEVLPHCNDDSGDEEYSCHGSWVENGTTFIVARHKGTKHGVCITYRPTELKNAKLIVGDTCFRGVFKAPDHLLVSNLTHYGKCGDPSGSNYPHPTMILLLSAILTALVYSTR